MPDPILDEEWRTVTRRRGYQVSSIGRVRSVNPKRYRNSGGFYYLKPSPDKNGYQGVDLYEAKTHHCVNVHTLVLEAFVGPCPEGMQCRHLDGNPANNRLGNLKWGTAKENADDRTRHGTTCQGSDHHRAIVDEDDVLRIRERYANGEYASDLAAEHGFTQQALQKLVNGASWKHVAIIEKRARQGPKGARHGLAKLDDAKVLEVKRRLASGEIGEAIAKDLGVSGSAITCIKTGRTWTHVKWPPDEPPPDPPEPGFLPGLI